MGEASKINEHLARLNGGAEEVDEIVREIVSTRENRVWAIGWLNNLFRRAGCEGLPALDRDGTWAMLYKSEEEGEETIDLERDDRPGVRYRLDGQLWAAALRILLLRRR